MLLETTSSNPEGRFGPKPRVRVDQDNRIVTSQTPGTAIEYALALVSMMKGADVSQETSDYFPVR